MQDDSWVHYCYGYSCVAVNIMKDAEDFIRWLYSTKSKRTFEQDVALLKIWMGLMLVKYESKKR